VGEGQLSDARGPGPCTLFHRSINFLSLVSGRASAIPIGDRKSVV
jgi:hypothetical protein